MNLSETQCPAMFVLNVLGIGSILCLRRLHDAEIFARTVRALNRPTEVIPETFPAFVDHLRPHFSGPFDSDYLCCPWVCPPVCHSDARQWLSSSTSRSHDTRDNSKPVGRHGSDTS